jgi:O-methyltransferase/methyltransferase family protein
MTDVSVRPAARPATGGPPGGGPPVRPMKILELGLAFWGSKTLLTAVELGVFTGLAAGPATEPELRERHGLHPRSARDFLDALVALGLLDRDGSGYRNTPETGLFLDRGKPSYLGGLLEMANARLYPFWGRLTEALQTGQPQNEAREGQDFFATLYADPDRLREFMVAMGASAGLMGAALAAGFDWSGHKSFVDVGGARGGVAARIAQAHPHLEGGCFDLPAVRPIFAEHIEELGLADRIRFHAGDFFADPLPETDVVIFGHVLHDWDLDTKKLLLRKAFAAVPPGGAVLVYDPMIDDGRRQNTFGLLSSLNMLIETTGGFEYTAADCQDWLAEVGFAETASQPLVGPDTLVIGRKP